jgi:predicted nucleic acid-binding protein
MAVEDAMIAATARASGPHAIATRNLKDFADCGVRLVDPWAISD